MINYLLFFSEIEIGVVPFSIIYLKPFTTVFSVNGRSSSSISPQSGINVNRPRSAGAPATRQQEYIRQVTSQTGQPIVHLQKAKQEEQQQQQQAIERQDNGPYADLKFREFSPQPGRSSVNLTENHPLYQTTASPIPTKPAIIPPSTPIQDYYTNGTATPVVAAYTTTNISNGQFGGGHHGHTASQYYSQPV